MCVSTAYSYGVMVDKVLQYKDPIITNAHHYRVVLYYCNRIPVLIVTLQTFLATTELTGYMA